MSKKRLLYVIVALVGFFALNVSLFPTPSVEAAKITLKAISAWGKNHTGVVGDYLPYIKRANEMLQEKYPGEVEIKYIGGPEAIPTRDQPEALRAGTVDMYYGTAAYYAGIAPAANTTKLSQLTSQEEKDVGVDAIYDEIHRKLLNSAYLGALGSQLPFQLYTVKKVTSVVQLKGLKIRTSPMYVDFLKALGTTPVATSPGDVYQALERGVVDGFMWPLVSIRLYGWQEVSKYVVGPSFYKVSHPLLMNAKKWDALPKHIQVVLMEALRLEVIAIDARTVEEINNEYKELKKAGMEIIKFSPADEKKYLDMAYEEGWKGQLKMESDYTSKLRKLLSK
ncbi:MAG: TRAP transporter substrate-binding protein DctP [Desulfobacterales bacterium]|nr:MAG: TRAP transporter substrate-binding protein DctP [Desulfobacterales bacterium]